MRTWFGFVIILALALGSCRKEEMLQTVDLPDPMDNIAANYGTLLATGTFVSGVHTTSGTAKLYEKALRERRQKKTCLSKLSD